MIIIRFTPRAGHHLNLNSNAERNEKMIILLADSFNIQIITFYTLFVYSEWFSKKHTTSKDFELVDQQLCLMICWSLKT